MAKTLRKSLAAWVPQLEVLPPVAAEHLRTWWGHAQSLALRLGHLLGLLRAPQRKRLARGTRNGRWVCAPLQRSRQETGDRQSLPLNHSAISSCRPALQSVRIRSGADGIEGDDE